MSETGEIEPTRGGVVRQFDVEIRIDEHVSGFQVAVGGVLLVKILRSGRDKETCLRPYKKYINTNKITLGGFALTGKIKIFPL